MKHRFAYIPTIIALAVFTGCSESEGMRIDDDPTRVPVIPRASVRNLTANTPDTETFPDGKDRFRLSAFMSGSDEPVNWSVTTGKEAFENEPVNTTAGVLTTATQKYYPPTGSPMPKLWFYAYAPASNATYNKGNGSTPPTIDYVITGSEDIMIGKVTNGNGIGATDRRQPEFTFSHLLKKLRFILVQGEGFASNINVTSIKICGCRTHASLDLPTGALTFSGETDGTIELTGTFAILPEQDAVELPNRSLMCEPGPELKLQIMAAGVSYSADITLGSPGPGIAAGGAGVSYLVKLTFQGTMIESTSEITPWEEVGQTSGEIK